VGIDNRCKSATKGSRADAGKWRAPFVKARLQGLHDEPRPGAPRTVTNKQVETRRHTDFGKHATLRDALEHARFGNSHRTQPNDHQPDLARLRTATASCRHLQTVTGPVADRKGAQTSRLEIDPVTNPFARHTLSTARTDPTAHKYDPIMQKDPAALRLETRCLDIPMKSGPGRPRTQMTSRAAQTADSVIKKGNLSVKLKAWFLVLTCLAALPVMAVLTIPVRLAAQEAPKYTVVDMGTFGGPDAYLNWPMQVLNESGVLPGYAATSTPHPNFPNFFSCEDLDCLYSHAFQWKAAWARFQAATIVRASGSAIAA
jgi:hypothetical protein